MAPNATHANSANYANAARGLTEVGGYSKSPSAYGAFDMAGNVTEWNETMVTGLARGLRGGAWRHDADHQHASERTHRGLPGNRNIVIGFRIAARE
jgi:formylglycine-generating enzyme required for sulfatase activity